MAKINREKYPYLNIMKSAMANKNMDEIAATVWKLYSANGLTMDEIAALNFYLMKTALLQNHNQKILNKKMGIKIDQLNSDGIFTIQKALLHVHADKHA